MCKVTSKNSPPLSHFDSHNYLYEEGVFTFISLLIHFTNTYCMPILCEALFKALAKRNKVPTLSGAYTSWG